MQNKHKNTHEKNGCKTGQKKGFSLIELSIVILIVSILITGSLGVSKTAINNSKAKVTKERMDTVYQAFTNFLAANRRLPCPAVPTLAKGTAGYGAEAATPGTCTSTFVSSTNAPNLSYGMVPITALNLDPSMAEDGWGTKFTYVVDRRFTKQSLNLAASDGFEITPGVPNEAQTTSTDLLGIDVQGPPISPGPGNLLLSNRNGVLFLMSHGANKFNGFNATGTAQNGTGVTDENNNSCNTCSTSGTTSFDRIFLTSSSDSNFDDTAIFKTKAQLVRDADLKFLMCSATEATRSGPITWAVNGAYGCSVCAGTANNSRICGTYGTWGAASTATCTISQSVCGVQSRLDGRWRVATQSSTANDFAISFSTQDFNNLTGYLTKTTSTTSGDFWTVNISGIYSIHWNYITGTMPQLAWIDKNQASTTGYGTIFSNAPGDILALRSHTGFNENSVNWVGYLSVNDVVRFKMSIAAPSMDTNNAWTVSFVLLQQV